MPKNRISLLWILHFWIHALPVSMLNRLVSFHLKDFSQFLQCRLNIFRHIVLSVWVSVRWFRTPSWWHIVVVVFRIPIRPCLIGFRQSDVMTSLWFPGTNIQVRAYFGLPILRCNCSVSIPRLVARLVVANQRSDLTSGFRISRVDVPRIWILTGVIAGVVVRRRYGASVDWTSTMLRASGNSD